eukprot:6174564-Pleurochrysis_carterae.AAC.2
MRSGSAGSARAMPTYAESVLHFWSIQDYVTTTPKKVPVIHLHRLRFLLITLYSLSLPPQS